MGFFNKAYHPPGTAPGTLTERPVEAPRPPRIRLTEYAPDVFLEQDIATPADCKPYLESPSITWIHVQGDVSADTLRNLGELFELHSLALEDVLNSGQRPKLDVYGEQYFIAVNLPEFGNGGIAVQQISLFFGRDYLISFSNAVTDPFEPVRQRLRNSGGKFRQRGVDYLLYTLLDLVIDAGFPMFERFGETLEDLEAELLGKPDRSTLNRIHQLKRELLLLRRSLWPQREVVNALLRIEQPFMTDETRMYLRDCYDHSVQIMDLLETYRDMATGMLDVYLSSISNRTNEIMRVLTLIATIFIPLTFIVGVYGMNFSHDTSPWAMPELHWYYGYPLIWLVMILITAGLLYYFRRNKWF
ncbi:MAG: magnesium/cobalt transporter CorA [Gammaproteobacteria bacterium]|nr:magnesium/cobalt transporter CorA [Gammaproteobacteria bacterium]